MANTTSSEQIWANNSNIFPGLMNIIVPPSGNLVIGGDLLPQIDNIYDIGEAPLRWRDLYLSRQLIINSASSQLSLGQAFKAIITITPTANYVLTIPDTGTNSQFVMNVGNQSISGQKTFSSALVASAGVQTNSVSSTSGAIALSGNTNVNITAQSGSCNVTGASTTNIVSQNGTCLVDAQGGNVVQLRADSSLGNPIQAISGNNTRNMGFAIGRAAIEAVFFVAAAAAAYTPNTVAGSSGIQIATGSEFFIGYSLSNALRISSTLNTSANPISVINTTNSTSSTTGALRTAGGLGVAQDAYIGGSLFLPTSGGTATALNYYETGTHTSTFSGAGFTTGNINFNVVRVGTNVTIQMTDQISGSASGGNISSTTNLPAKWRPVADTSIIIVGRNAGTDVPIAVTIASATGNILFRRQDLTTFTIGQARAYPFSISYITS